MNTIDDDKIDYLLLKIHGQKLETLDISALGLRTLPKRLLDVAGQVHHLKIGSSRAFSIAAQQKNAIDDFRILSQFKNLKKLTLSGLKIQRISQISFLGQLEELDLDNNELYNLEGIEQMPQLNALSVVGNYLTRIDELAGLSKLRTLNLSKNIAFNLSVLQKGGLPGLRTLNLAHGSYQSSDLVHLAWLKKLEWLDISNNLVDDLSDLPYLARLESLIAINNNIASLDSLGYKHKLKKLDLSGNRIFDLGPLAQQENLRVLGLRDNRIDDVGPLSAIPGLEDLNLAGNSIAHIRQLMSLEKLQMLNLDRNNISDLKPLKGLQDLRSLSLANNRIADIRPLGSLKKLDYLNLRRNQVSDISPLKSLLKGKKDSFKVAFEEYKRVGWRQNGIYLSDNPITNPPRQYLNAGPKAILSYWEQQEKQAFIAEKKTTVSEAKLIIVGNSNAGKSTLSSLLRNRELPAQDLSSTHGLEFAAWRPGWKVGGHDLTVNIIDFGGQEYYHDTHHLFFNNRAAYLVLWDPATNINAKIDTPVGNRDQLATVRHFNIEYWLNAISIYSGTASTQPAHLQADEPVAEEDPIAANSETKDEPAAILPLKTPVLLVQTHADQRGIAFLNMKDIQEKYPQLMGAAAVSMDTKNRRFKGFDLLELSIRQLFEESTENFSQEYFESWLRIRKHIEEKEKGEFHVMTIKEFKKYFETHSGSKAKYSIGDIQTLCITLDYWGAVLYKYAIDELRTTVVINPQQFTSRISSLLTEDIREKNGVFSDQSVKDVLKTDEEKTMSFISILKTFKIIFELPVAQPAAQQLYISPMYLHEKPAYVDLFLSNFVAYYKIRYKGYFHKGILLDCFSRLGKELYFEKGLYFYWQWGLVLKRESRIVSIEFDEAHLDQVRISAIRRGSESLGQDPFLQHILAAFEEINADYACDLEISCDGSSFVSKAGLLKEMHHGLSRIACQDKIFPVRDFSFLLKDDEIVRPAKRIFVSYSSKDRRYLDQLSSHLELYKKAGQIDYWTDLMLVSREEWDPQILDEMKRANILIMMLSPAYLSTSYILEKEIPAALDHLNSPNRRKQVYWIQLRPCSFEIFTDVSKYPVYPLKEIDTLTGVARQRAISEHPDWDREWVKLLEMILGTDM